MVAEPHQPGNRRNYPGLTASNRRRVRAKPGWSRLLPPGSDFTPFHTSLPAFTLPDLHARKLGLGCGFCLRNSEFLHKMPEPAVKGRGLWPTGPAEFGFDVFVFAVLPSRREIRAPEFWASQGWWRGTREPFSFAVALSSPPWGPAGASGTTEAQLVGRFREPPTCRRRRRWRFPGLPGKAAIFFSPAGPQCRLHTLAIGEACSPGRLVPYLVSRGERS
jgi:hypothetical protein